MLSMVLAGGEGKRLFPLTADRAKPAVPFGGHYRLIDFALSNLANGGFLRIVVLTQYKSHSLDLHISRTWRLSTLLSDYVTPVPAQMRVGPRWFAGSADAIFQNLNLIGDERPDYTLVFGADHIYRMDPSQMLEQHIATGAGVTVAAIRVPADQSREFGVVELGGDTRIAEFKEKPEEVTGLADAPDQVLASMGNYIFTTKTLVEAVVADEADQSSVHDVGGSIIPMLVGQGTAHCYDFSHNEVPGATERDKAYWRDVGTLDSYYDAHMDMVSVHPVFNLYNMQWPIHTLGPEPAAGQVRAGGLPPRRPGPQLHGLRRSHRLRRRRAAVGALARRPRRAQRPGRELGGDARGGDRRGRGRPQRHRRQEREGPARRHPGRRPRGRQGPLHGLGPRGRRGRQGGTGPSHLTCRARGRDLGSRC